MLYLEPDSVVYTIGDTVHVSVHIVKPEKCEDRSADLELYAVVKSVSKSIEISKLKEKIVIGDERTFTKVYDIDIKPEVGTAIDSYGELHIEATVSICNTLEKDSTYLYIYPSVKHLLDLVIVWHHHQPPNYLPNGTFFGDYPFRWVWYNLFEPYISGGPYFIHALVYKSFPNVKTTVHLSPSLLNQWRIAIENGYTLENGVTIPRDDSSIAMISKTLDIFKELVRNNSIEMLTSVYAHTIPGFILSRFGVDDIVYEELELGKNITKEIIGVEPVGAWTPEMAWHNRLTEIYRDMGFKYTILCGKSHYRRAIGSKRSPYELYRMVYGDSSIYILFRDQEISDTIGFNNNFPNIRIAYEAARDVVRMIVRRRGIVTIALDGENWMIFSKYPSNTYPFFNYMYRLIDVAQKKGFVKTLLGREAVEKYGDGANTLIYIPTTSWLNGFYKWDGEIPEQKYVWREVEKLLSVFRAYRYVYGDADFVKKAKWAIYHIVDSDYWWAEFWNPRVIKEWINEFYKSIYSYKGL